MPKYASRCICFSIILSDSVFAIDKTYYLKVCLEECKDLVKERKMERYFDSDYEIITSFDDFD